MEICKSYKIVPKDLYVKKDLCMNLRKIITNVFLVMYMLCIIKLKQRQAALRALTHLTPRYLRKALYHQTICKTIKPSNYIKGNPKIIEIINS